MKKAIVKHARAELFKQADMARKNLDIANAALTKLAQIELDDDPATFTISIFSAWSSEGEPSLTGFEYTGTLQKALETAATAFCRLAGRVAKGDKREYVREGEAQTYTFWDVQGSWSVAVKIGDAHVSLPEKMTEKTIKSITAR